MNEDKATHRIYKYQFHHAHGVRWYCLCGRVGHWWGSLKWAKSYGAGHVEIRTRYSG